MNLRDLSYFIALADHLHFGRAAAASFVSQPTLSTQIRKLEEELGVALVERAPRKVMLTAAGRDVATRARRVVADIEQMREAARRSQDPEAGTVTLGLFPTLGPYLLPHVVPGIRARFPQLELLLVGGHVDEAAGHLGDHRRGNVVLGGHNSARGRLRSVRPPMATGRHGPAGPGRRSATRRLVPHLALGHRRRSRGHPRPDAPDRPAIGSLSALDRDVPSRRWDAAHRHRPRRPSAGRSYPSGNAGH